MGKQRKMKVGDLVMVEWRDAYSEGGWSGLEEFLVYDPMCQSVGRVLQLPCENWPDLVLCADWGSDCSYPYGRLMAIPEKMINDIPFPIPRWLICSPSHMRKIVPAVTVSSDTKVYMVRDIEMAFGMLSA